MSKAKKARDEAQALDSQIAAKSPETKVVTESDDELGADFDPSQIGLNGMSFRFWTLTNWLIDVTLSYFLNSFFHR
jgi:hypothetical protein